MPDKPSLREQAASLAQRMDLALDDRASALIDALGGFESVQQSSLSDAPATLPHTDGAILAAIADTFALEEIGDTASEEAEAILCHCDTITIGGKRRLRLRKPARLQFLNAVSEQSRYQDLLLQQIQRDMIEFEQVARDPVRCASAWLRRMLYGHYPDLNRAPISELRAAVQALGQIERVHSPRPIPSVDQARDQLELAEMLEPLRMLIGARGDWDGSRARDRFVGRTDELRELRSHVDALDSQSFGESISRQFLKIGRGATSLISGRNPGVLMLRARGGMGKSSLLAKFILDHSRHVDRDRNTRHVPTIYLDFDRAGLQPREPRQLFMEAVRQIRLQLPDIAEPLRALEKRVGESLIASSPGRDGFDLARAAVEFRHHIRSKIGHGGTILLVLDTMEVVQALPDALDKVVEFVDILGTRDFPELRIVVAGRAEVPELMAATEWRDRGDRLELAPLSIGDATEMTLRLGRELVGDDWKRAWSSQIVGDRRSDPARREPLTLRMAVELIRSETDTAGRNQRAREIAEQPIDASGTFVGALYRRRILGHLRDPEVRKLAWPGLVLRRITLPMVREMLMAPCGLDPLRLPQTFEALAREVWIVTREGEGADLALRHLADLRSRTLPLMRAHDPQLFARVNRAAIEYFGQRQARDVRARAEWIYHRLLDGQPSHEVCEDWREEMTSLLSGAEDDFVAGSDAHGFLLARTARKRLPVATVLALPCDLALEHIARYWPDLGDPAEDRLVPLLVSLPLDRMNPARHSRAMSNVRFALQVKSGRWAVEGAAPERSETWYAAAEEAYHYHAARSLIALEWDAPRADDLAGMLRDPASRRRYARRLGNQLLRSARFELDSPAWREQDQTLGKLLPLLAQDREGRSYTAPLFDTDLLRAAASIGEDTLYPGLQLALARDQVRLDSDRGYSAEEIRCLLRSDRGPELGRHLSRLDRALFSRVESGDASEPLRISDRSWLLRIEDCLRELLLPSDTWNPGRSNRLALRQYAAARNGDWLLPIAYAAARATASKIPDAVFKRLQRHSRDTSLPFRSQPSSRRLQDEVLQVLRLADEASDLIAVAQLFVDAAVDRSAREDLAFLLTCLGSHRVGLQAAILRLSWPD